MKTPRPKILGREFWLLSLPLLLLGGVALLRAAVPNLSDLNPNRLRIQVDSIEQVEPSPCTRCGNNDDDTAVRVKLRVAGMLPFTNRNGWDWISDVRLVAVKDGKVLAMPLWNQNGEPFFISNISTTFNSPSASKSECNLRLHNIPHEWDDLVWYGRVAFGPWGSGVTPLSPDATTKSIIDDIEKTGKGIILPIKIPVKRLDE